MECGRHARGLVKAEGRVRLPAWALRSTREPDGTAAACKAVEVGSTPTCVSTHGLPGVRSPGRPCRFSGRQTVRVARGVPEVRRTRDRRGPGQAGGARIPLSWLPPPDHWRMIAAEPPPTYSLGQGPC